jgi:SAM-dependent methyltransferase
MNETSIEWFAMIAGMELDLFTPLDTGPMTAPELATVLNVDAGKLSLLLYALVIAGLLTVEDGRFANTDESATAFVRGKPGYMGSAYTLWKEFATAGLKTAESVRTGIPQAQHNYAAMTEDELFLTLGGLHATGLITGRELAARYDFSDCRTLLDAGGGSGAKCFSLVEAWPQLHATIADLPNVVPITERFVKEAGLSERIDVVAVDLLREAPPGKFDVAVLALLIQVLSATNAQIALRNVARSLRQGGTIYLLNLVLDESRITPAGPARTNLIFLNWYDGGQAYTEGEYRGWLAEAGFEEITREESFRNGMGLIRARKAG